MADKTTSTRKHTAPEGLTLTIDRVLFTEGDFTIIKGHTDDAPFALVNATMPARGRHGQRWLLHGKWGEHARYGRQYKAIAANLATPTTDDQLDTFLAALGWSFGQLVTLRTYLSDHTPGDCPYDDCAIRALAAIGIDGVLDDLGTEPDPSGLSEAMLEGLRDAMDRGGSLGPVYAQLTEWDLHSDVIDRLVTAYGANAADVLQRNPYDAIAEVSGYGWQTADTLARTHLAIESDDPRRVAAGIGEAVERETERAGHTWLTYPAAVSSAQELLRVGTDAIERELTAIDQPSYRLTDSRVWPRDLYDAENVIANKVAALLEKAPLMPQVYVESEPPIDVHTISPEQMQAVDRALMCRISLLTGGPGCGKTTTIREMIRQAKKRDLAVTCMAPTGKAALRMTEATGYPAKTIHSAIGLVPQSIHPNIREPLGGMVIVDECSMLDTRVAAAVLLALGDAHLVLVGDPDQLPSVGPGAVLRDLLLWGCIARTHLDKVYRNDAGIAINAAHIRHNERIQNLPDCAMVAAQNAEQVAEGVRNLLFTYEDETPAFPADCLVLSGTNELRHKLNRDLQAAYNGAGTDQEYVARIDKDNSFILRPGDPCIVTRNDPKLKVFNGQMGRVVAIGHKTVTAELDGEQVVFTGDQRRLLQLAYCITGHKSQGSEAPVVICAILPSRVLSREWLYTVLTRARKQVYLVGDPSAMQGAIGRTVTDGRNTALLDRFARRA